MGKQNKVKLKKFNEFFGIDKHTSSLSRLEGYSEDIINLQYTDQNKLGPRNGTQPIASGSGPFGLVTYNRFLEATGGYETHILSVSDTLLKLAEDILTITYAGASTCLVTVYPVVASSIIKFKIVEGSTTKLDYSLGKGYDEASPVTLAGLKTQIDAISGGSFSAVITGTTTTPAAFIRRVKNKVLTAIQTAAFSSFHWTETNRPVSSMLSWFTDNRNSDDLVNCRAVQSRNSVFFPNPTTGYGMMKYDGVDFYRAGVPTPAAPIIAVTNAASGVAEITTVLCRAAAAVAEVSTVTTIADTGIAEVVDLINISGGFPAVSHNNLYFVLYGITGGVAKKVVFWFNYNVTGSQPSVSGADEYVSVALPSGGGPSSVETAAAAAIDAHAYFVTSGSGTIRVTNANTGDVPLAEAGTSYVTVSGITNGTSGLQDHYFSLYDENGKTVFWINIAGAGVQPTIPGANRYVAITGITAAMSANSVGTQVKNTVDADSKFSASVVSNVVTITDTSSVLGERTNVDAGDSGFAVAVGTAGLDSLHQKYLYLYDDDNLGVAFWFDLTSSGIEPAHGQPRAVKVTGLTTASTNAEVATGLETFIEADDFSSTVSTATITATANTTGAKTDGSSGTTGFTVTVTTQGGNAGPGIGDYKVRLSVIQRDANGVTIEGNLTDVQTVTLGSAEDVRLTITGVQPNTGYNTACAKVNGNQAGATTITVDTGHTLKAGHQAYLLNRANQTYVTRTISAITSTTIVLDTAVSVTDNDIISNGLRIGYYRSKTDQPDLFLVAELPNNSLDGTFTYQDGALDAALGAQLQIPVVDRSPPGRFKFLTQYKSVLVAGGFFNDRDQVGYSDLDGPEYWPASGASFICDTEQGDGVAVVAENNEVLIVGKMLPQKTEGSLHVVSGGLDELQNFVRDVKSGSMGMTSQSAVVELLPGTKAFMANNGPKTVVGGNMPADIGFRVNSMVQQQFAAAANVEISLRRVTAINDSLHKRVLFFIPIEPKTGTKYANTASFVLVYDYAEDPQGQPSSRWVQFSGINAAGGFSKNGRDILFVERRLSAFTGNVDSLLWVFNSEGTELDVYDHVANIRTDWKTRWEDLDEPDANKFFKWLKLWVEPAISEGAFSVAVVAEFDHSPGVTRSSKTISYTGSTSLDEDDMMKFNEGKAKSCRLTFTTTDAAVNFRYSGYALEAYLDYSESMAT